MKITCAKNAMKPNEQRIKAKRDSGRSNKKTKRRDITKQIEISKTGKEKKSISKTILNRKAKLTLDLILERDGKFSVKSQKKSQKRETLKRKTLEKNIRDRNVTERQNAKICNPYST